MPFLKRKSSSNDKNSELSREEVLWCEEARRRGLTTYDVGRTLENQNIDFEKKNAILKFYDNLLSLKTIKEDEEIFKNQVGLYFNNPKELSWRERREVKKWLGEIAKTKEMIVKLKKNMDSVMTNSANYSKEDLAKVRAEIIETIIVLEDLFEMEHPDTGEILNRENIQTLNNNQLNAILEIYASQIDDVRNGKV